MKKILSVIIMTAILSMLLVSCGTGQTDEADGSIHLVSTIFPGYDIIRALTRGAEDKFELTMLLPPGSESHDYEASVSDLALVEKATLIVAVGGETDAWLDDVIRASGSDARLVKMTDCVPLFCESDEGLLEDGGHHHEHEHGDECGEDHGEYDEHVWTSPRNMALICGAVYDELSDVCPEYANLLNQNKEDYTSNLNSLADEMESAAAKAKLDTLVFADRFPFRYLTEALGLHSRAAFSGCSSSSEPSLSTIYRLAEFVKEVNIPAVLTVEFSEGRAAQVIADETGADVYTLHSCHNLSAEDFSSGVTYLEMMRENLAVLKICLGCE